MNNYTHHHAALHHSSLAIAAVAMAITLNSCQDYEYGFTEEEIHQDALNRNYNKEFQKAFPNVDPEHTWTCVPDTVYGAQLRVLTRGTAAEVPTVIKTDSTLIITFDEAKAALEYMKEKEDNRGQCGQDFEYISTEEKNVFDIHPVFWGQKFVDTNFVGVWYIGSDNKKHDLPPFWCDAPNKNPNNYEGSGYNNVTCDVEAHYNIPNTSYVWRPVNATENQITEITVKENNNTYKPDKFSFPSFKVEVPVGMKWGLYLQTKTTQSGGKDIRWYSNAEYNVNKCSAAASFEFGGINYVSFEDAPNPYNCTDNGKPIENGNHNCHGWEKYGHYDHDMNDIILAITPHPIESTYRAIKYRVMCEDLGGTFDWDFNDLVLDVIYEEGTQSKANATTKIEVKAVGGTLPIELNYSGDAEKVISKEVHAWFGQTPIANDLYEPINVGDNHTETPSKVAYIVHHNWKTKSEGYDVRDVVKNISVKVNGHTTVVFPDSKGDNMPQCFMCPINVDWSSELVNISMTYSDFPAWVASQGETDWWKSGFNTGTQEIKQ